MTPEQLQLMEGHSPGPWAAELSKDERREMIEINGGGLAVADVCGHKGSLSEQEWNRVVATGHLIAAAPRLLLERNALLALVYRFNAICKRGGDIQRGTKGKEHDLQAQIDAVITLAES